MDSRPLCAQISHLPHLAQRPPCLSHAALTTPSANSIAAPPYAEHGRPCPATTGITRLKANPGWADACSIVPLQQIRLRPRGLRYSAGYPHMVIDSDNTIGDS